MALCALHLFLFIFPLSYRLRTQRPASSPKRREKCKINFFNESITFVPVCAFLHVLSILHFHVRLDAAVDLSFSIKIIELN